MRLGPRGSRGQTGSSTTELVLLMPVVFLLVLLIVQFGLWLHARQVATAAAQDGLTAAQMELGTSVAGRERAERFAAEGGGLREVQIDAVRNATSARVTVAAVTPTVLPGMTWNVSVVAEGPVERWIAEIDR